MADTVEIIDEKPVVKDEKPSDLEIEIKRLRQEAAEKRKANKELQEKLAQIESEKTEFEQKQLEEQSKFKELYENSKTKLSELEVLKAELSKYREREEADRLNILNQLPDHLKERHANDGIEILKTIHELTQTAKAANSIGSEIGDVGKNVSNLDDLDKLAATDPIKAMQILRQMQA